MIKVLIPCKGFSVGGGTAPTYYATLECPDSITIGGQNTFSLYCDPSNTGASSSALTVAIDSPDGGQHMLFQGVSPSTTPKRANVSFSANLWASYPSANRMTFLARGISNSALVPVEKELYAHATQSMAPTFDLRVLPTANIVQGKTAVTATIVNEAGKYGASIRSRSVNIAGVGGSGASLSVVPSANGTIRVSAAITDSRGLSATRSMDVSVVAYSPPAVRYILLERANASGVIDPEGTKARVSVGWDSGGSAGGTTSCHLKYRAKGASAFTEYGRVDSGETYVIDGPFPTDTEYEFVATASDSLSSVSKSENIGMAYFTMDFRKGGKGIAFGQACTEDGFTVNMPTVFKKPITLEDPAKNSLFDQIVENDSITRGKLDPSLRDSIFHGLVSNYNSVPSQKPKTVWISSTGESFIIETTNGTRYGIPVTKLN